MCTTLYRNLVQVSNSVAHLTNFSFDFFYEIFTKDASPLQVQKTVNMTKKLKSLYSFVRLPRKAIIYQVRLPSYFAETPVKRSDRNASPGCLLWTINSPGHPKSTLSYRKLAKRSAFSEETYISFRLPLAVFFYLAVIQPDLEYAATATTPFMSTSLRDRLCSVWRRAVRCVAGVDWQAEVAPILKNHRLTSIEHRWALQFAVVVRRCVQKSAPLSLCTRLSFYRNILIKPGEAEILFDHSVPPLSQASSHSLTERHLFGTVCQQVLNRHRP